MRECAGQDGQYPASAEIVIAEHAVQGPPIEVGIETEHLVDRCLQRQGQRAAPPLEHHDPDRIAELEAELGSQTIRQDQAAIGQDGLASLHIDDAVQLCDTRIATQDGAFIALCIGHADRYKPQRFDPRHTRQTCQGMAERAWELASLRVLGFTRTEVSAMLLGEMAIVIAVALPAGMLSGHAMVALIAELMKSDQLHFPVVIAARTYAWAGLCVLMTGAASALVVRRRIDRLNLVEVLKTRE